MPKAGEVLKWGAVGFVGWQVYKQWRWMRDFRDSIRLPQSPGGDEDVFGGGDPGPYDNPWGEGF